MIRRFPKVLKLPTWLVVLLLIPYLFLLPRAATRDDIKVLGVIDGDTLVLDGKVRLRLRHIDAPELEFCGGQEAKNLLTDLVKGKSVRVEEKIMDQQGRPMALVYVGSPAGPGTIPIKLLKQTL